MDKNQLKQIIMDQRQDATSMLNDTLPRQLDEALLSLPEIVIIMGVRRCGKSVVLQQWRSRQTEQDYYINFDDDRLVPFTLNDFQTLYECFVELFGTQKTFYFDEIQNIVGWETFVRRLYNGGNKVYVTGSNAHMLSRELGTHLTGRYVSLTMYPFSFKEYLMLKGINMPQNDAYTTTGRATINSQVQNYMREGGFPGYIRNPHTEYLSSLYKSIVYRDVIIRNNISGEHELLELVHYLASNTSKLFSYSSLAKAVGIKHNETVKNYMDALEQTYLIAQLKKYDPSVKKQLANNRKVYFIDTAITSRIGFNPTDNYGQQLENMVFVELLRRGGELYYHSGKQECDFVVRSNNQISMAIQVTVSLSNPDTRKREVNGLLEAMNAYNLPEGYILTLGDNAETITINEKTVRCMPVGLWMLQ